jgi:hypothetical protein
VRPKPSFISTRAKSSIPFSSATKLNCCATLPSNSYLCCCTSTRGRSDGHIGSEALAPWCNSLKTMGLETGFEPVGVVVRQWTAIDNYLVISTHSDTGGRRQDCFGLV